MKVLIQRYWSLLPVLVLLSGCATGSRSVNYAEHVSPYGVDAHLVEKMEARVPLELVDLIHLSEKGVPDTLLIGYLQQSRAVYQLNTDHVQQLANGGVSKSVIDYMLSTPTVHAPPTVRPFYYLPPAMPYHYGFGYSYGLGYYCW